MSELQFPKDPIVGQEYDFPPYRYYWDGVKWKTKGIEYNPVNDLRDELEPRIKTSEKNIEDLSAQSFEALRRSYAETGLNLVDGSFEEGGTLTSTSDVLLYKKVGAAYSGPVSVVTAGTDPTAGGSVYVSQANAILRSDLLDGALRTRDGLLSLRDIVSVADFGAVGGTTNDTAAFTDALTAGGGYAFVPYGSGVYRVDGDLEGLFGFGNIRFNGTGLVHHIVTGKQIGRAHV